MDRFEPKAEAGVRRLVLAEFKLVTTLLVAALSMKSVPLVRFARPRPAALNVTPVMLSVDLPVSLKVSFSVSPFNRLTPLNEASCAVVVIWARMLLYCDTRPERRACADGSRTGTRPVEKVSAWGTVPPIAPPDATVPRVEEA